MELELEIELDSVWPAEADWETLAEQAAAAVSYTHLTLPTNREV